MPTYEEILGGALMGDQEDGYAERLEDREANTSPYQNPPFYITAYGLALRAGFCGTLEEWLESLIGPKGETGAALTYDMLTDAQKAELKGKDGNPGAPGKDGITFTPAVDSAGNLSWSNDGGRANPTTVNIKGPKGEDGSPGKAFTYEDFTPEQLETLKGKDGVAPHIGSNGHWCVGNTDTGVAAQGAPGAPGEPGKAGSDGLTPYIGANGHWYIGEADTGVQARGVSGKDGRRGPGILKVRTAPSVQWYDEGSHSYSTFGFDLDDVKRESGAAEVLVGDTILHQDKLYPINSLRYEIVSVGAAVSIKGNDGEPGEDGVTPHIGANGNWWIGEIDTGVSAGGAGGGEAGVDGVTFTPHIDAEGNLSWTNDGGLDNPEPVNIRGPKGLNGGPGSPGEPGEDGITPHIGANGNWWVGENDTGYAASGKDGRGIEGFSCEPSYEDGGVNVIAFRLTGGVEDSFEIRNGSKGNPGEPGEDGLTPFIKNGNWWIGETDTGVAAQGPAGANGTNGDPGSPGSPGKDGVDGKDGQRGTGTLKVTTAPSSYTTAIGSYTPKYRIALSTVKTQSGKDEVLIGDLIQYSYYQYHVDYLDDTYAYISESRVSIRGASGADGAAGSDANVTAENITAALGYTPADAADLQQLYNEKADIHNAVGTTYPPAQKPAATEFDGYDIDILNSTADDIFAYIDEVVDGKETVTKEIMGKDASGQYDIARYTFANRDYLAWQKKNYPAMYAWKNGNTIKYTKSVSPRIGEKAFDVPYVQTTTTGGETVPAFTNLKDQCTFQYGKRYSLSSGGFKAQSGVSTIVVPVPAGQTNITVRMKGVTASAGYSNVYGGTSPTAFTEELFDKFSQNNMSPDADGVYTITFVKSSGCTYASFHLAGTQASDFADAIVTVNEPIEYTTGGGGVEVENGTPITAMSATNRSRTIGGVVYTRYEDGDVAPTVIYTDKDDERNGGATITKDGVTYNRYPLGDLGSNRTKLTPIFICANEHGYITDHTYEGHESKICALVAARFLRDLADGKQVKNPMYKYIRENCMVVMLPVVNPFGINMNIKGGSSTNPKDGYRNANGVNINRNYDTPGWDVMYANGNTSTNTTSWMGAYAGSENETQYVMNTVVESGASVAMSLHELGGYNGYCAHQGQNPNPEVDGYVDYDQEKLAKIEAFLTANWGYKMRYYDMENGEPVRVNNTPDVTSKSPSFFSQCGAYGGIVEFQADDVNTSGFALEMKSNVIENAYAQMLNLMAMWLSDYIEANN